jgi:uncharacterized membrane protein
VTLVGFHRQADATSVEVLRSRVMIVEARAVAPTSLQAVSTRLRRLLVAQELADFAASAAGDGETVQLRAGIAGVSKQIAVQALEPVYGPDRVVVAMRWVATGLTGDLFPTLDGNLELRGLCADATEVVLIGSYRPPLGRTGEVIDHLLMGRVARRTVQSFVSRLARAVTEPTPALTRA